MPTGVVLYPNPNAVNVVDDVVSQARRAYELGVRQVWLAQQFDHDAIALAGLVGAAVPGLGVGTSVVPINPRHPLIVASLAQTAQAAAHGNFSLGLGLGAHEPERLAFGTAWPNTISRLREHLEVLRSVFDTGAVDFHGDEFSASPAWPVKVAGGTPVPVYVAAMGPKALRARWPRSCGPSSPPSSFAQTDERARKCKSIPPKRRSRRTRWWGITGRRPEAVGVAN